MQSIIKRILIISLPLSIIALFMLTAKGEMTFIDGPNKEVIGFPFLWAMDGVNSMSIEISLLPLVSNFLVYFIVTSFICIPITKRLTKFKLVGGIFWSLCIVVCICMGIWIFIDPSFSALFKFSEQSELINYHFVFFGFIG